MLVTAFHLQSSIHIYIFGVDVFQSSPPSRSVDGVRPGAGIEVRCDFSMRYRFGVTFLTVHASVVGCSGRYISSLQISEFTPEEALAGFAARGTIGAEDNMATPR